jgi:hypothetical protein
MKLTLSKHLKNFVKQFSQFPMKSGIKSYKVDMNGFKCRSKRSAYQVLVDYGSIQGDSEYMVTIFSDTDLVESEIFELASNHRSVSDFIANSIKKFEKNQ